MQFFGAATIIESETPEGGINMPRTVKNVLKIFGVLITAALVFAIVLVGWLSITEFKPDPVEVVPVSIHGNEKTESPVLEESVRVLTFNIGYCNLGKESDFFMDGGENVRNGDEELVLKNLDGVMETIEKTDADILLLQEVDFDSSRSFRINEAYMISEHFGGKSSIAMNYNCDFVPFPWPPIGTVASGIMTHTDLNMETGRRIALPCPFNWPVSAANLKRCLLVNYFDVEGSDKQLAVVNLHLEAYDDGEGKIAQTKMLWDILTEEYAKGNYVIAGGDFNQMFPGTEEIYPITTAELWEPGVLEKSALPEGWRYVYDDTNPTCRLLNQPYDPASENTQYYVIDGFIVSPNVELVSVETVDAEFEFSDHNPVVMEVVLK